MSHMVRMGESSPHSVMNVESRGRTGNLREELEFDDPAILVLNRSRTRVEEVRIHTRMGKETPTFSAQKCNGKRPGA